MTISSITELSSFLTANVSLPVQNVQQNASNSSFADVMSQTDNLVKTGNNQMVSAPKTGETADARKNTFEARVTRQNSSEGRSAIAPNENGNAGAEDKVSETEDLDRNEQPDNPEAVISEILSDTVGKTEQLLADKFDLTVEEIEEVLGTLGLTTADLLNPANVQLLYTELSGAADAAALLTNEDLYQGLQELMADVTVLNDELKQQLGMSDEQFAKVIEEFEQTEAGIVTEKADDTESLEMSGKSTEEAAEPKVIIEDLRKPRSENAVDHKSEITDNIEKDIPGDEKVNKGQESGQERQDTGSLFGNDNTFADSLQETSATDMNSEVLSYSDNVQAAEIERQIVEQIRVRVTEQTTSLEMELNPASLGKVGLAIEAKNGVITASFTAQNEAVKEVIEGQLVQLQENLDKQGIKVEAVEVTIASHEFEENLDRKNQQSEQSDEAEKLQKAIGRRRMSINLMEEDADEESEGISEEEAINKDMMLRNGNSVDFMA